jgi:hypothetical protein
MAMGLSADKSALILLAKSFGKPWKSLRYLCHLFWVEALELEVCMSIKVGISSLY